MRRAMMILVRAMSVAVAVLLSDAACAEVYPARPVKVIVPFAPAGPADVLARLLTQKLSASFGQQFYVENQAGAGGNLGMGAAARATPDGYTLALVSTSFVVNPSLYPRIPYDPFKDFAPVTLVAVSPNVLVVHPSIPANDVAELIRFIRTSPGKLSFASAGLGTTPHLSGELFRTSQQLDIVHVPFNGSGPAIARPLPATPQLRSRCSRRRAQVREGSCAPWRSPLRRAPRHCRMCQHWAKPDCRIRRPIQCSAFLRPPVRPPAPSICCIARSAMPCANPM